MISFTLRGYLSLLVIFTTIQSLFIHSINANDFDADAQSNTTLRIITRDEWLAQPPTSPLEDQTIPINRLIIAHTATEGCHSQAECTFRVRFIQTYHMESLNWDDIGYNFLIGGDGNVYEGRGWSKVGAHTKGYNVGSVCLAFIGTFKRVEPTEKQLDATKLLIEEGVKLGYLTKEYKLYPHRAFFATESPGDLLYDKIKTWPHFTEEV